MTMYEKIQNMTVVELARFLLDGNGIEDLLADACTDFCPECYSASKCTDEKCLAAMVKFLESEVK